MMEGIKFWIGGIAFVILAMCLAVLFYVALVWAIVLVLTGAGVI